MNEHVKTASREILGRILLAFGVSMILHGLIYHSMLKTGIREVVVTRTITQVIDKPAQGEVTTQILNVTTRWTTGPEHAISGEYQFKNATNEIITMKFCSDPPPYLDSEIKYIITYIQSKGSTECNKFVKAQVVK